MKISIADFILKNESPPDNSFVETLVRERFSIAEEAIRKKRLNSVYVLSNEETCAILHIANCRYTTVRDCKTGEFTQRFANVYLRWSGERFHVSQMVGAK